MRHALRADLPRVVETWVDAFSADPFLRWVVPSDTAWPGFGTAWMTFIAEHCFERGHTFVGDGVAIAWIPPDLALIGPDDLARGRAILAEHSSEERAEDALDTILRARASAIAAPHWTLQYLGVATAAQGTGVGAAAVTPTLAVVDRDGLPCGLTSSNPRNLSFYHRFGFEVTVEVATPDGAVVLRPMERGTHPPGVS